MTGVPGNARCVLVYEKLNDGFPRHPFKGDPTRMQLEKEPTRDDFSVVAEEPTESQVDGGLNRPALIHPNGRWSLILFTASGGQNAFEACLEFTHGGKSFHPGGVSEDKDFMTPEEVISRVFKSLSWAKFEKADPTDKEDFDKMVPVTGVKVYPGP